VCPVEAFVVFNVWRGDRYGHLHVFQQSPLEDGRSARAARVVGSPVIVEVKNNNVDFALRVLKRKVQKSGITRELRRRRHYEKPSERRRRQKRDGIKNTRKREMASRG
jgi:small subunit ribosomal protein S21